MLDGSAKVTEVRRQLVKVRPDGTGNSMTMKRRASNKPNLFEALRQHRKTLSEQLKVPPYLIFPDTVLIDMASMRPQTLADLYKIKGIGEAKLQRFGLSFLKVNQYIQ